MIIKICVIQILGPALTFQRPKVEVIREIMSFLIKESIFLKTIFVYYLKNN